MSKGGIDRLIADAQDILGAQIASEYDQRVAKMASPIEALFERAMHILIRIDGPDPLEPWIRPIIDRTNFKTDPCQYLQLTMGDQVRVLDWPVDFLFIAQDFNDKMHFAVVECDGHAYHERTKEQAQRDRSRDRRLQEEGYRVFRFTGSELYRDPLGCAREVLKWADACWQIGLPS